MKRAALLLLLIAAPVVAGTVRLLWDHSGELPEDIKEYRVLVATNGRPWHATHSVKGLGWTNTLAPGMWRLGLQTVLKDGATSEVWSVGFLVEPEPEKQKALMFHGNFDAQAVVLPGERNAVLWLKAGVMTNDAPPIIK